MIWVTGASGMLGTDVVRRLGQLGMPYIETGRDCDLRNEDDVRALASDRSIDWIINCAAYTAVDRAEDEESEAMAVNGEGPRNLGRVANEVGARVIHVSTDYVFDGRSRSPYPEEARPSPQGAYGRTKAAGEQRLADATAAHFIVRTAWLYGVHGKSFVSTMLKLMPEQEELGVVDDQHGSPTYTVDLADAICRIVASDSRAFGLYHYTNEGATTWFDFARAIYAAARARGKITRECYVRGITTQEYPTRAVRPRYSVLDTARIKATFGLTIPSWRNALQRYFDELERQGGMET